MMRSLLIFILCIAASLVTAQKQAKIVLGKSKKSFNSADFYISKVIDARTSKEAIGLTQRGLNNRKDPVDFVSPLEVEVLRYFQSLFKDTHNKKPIVAIVHNLWVSEKTTMTSETGMADAVIEFVSEGSEDVSLGTYTSHNKSKGLDVTNGHPKRLRKAIFDCVVQFKKSAITGEGGKVEKLEFDKGIPSELKIGLYRSHIDMISNMPKDYSTQIVMTSNQVDEHITRYQIRKNKKTGKRYKDYAYYNGKVLLLNSSNITGAGAAYYLKNMTTGRYLVYVDRYQKQGTTAFFGAVGAIASTRKRISVLDMSTGVIDELSNEEILDLLLVSPKWHKSFLNSSQKVDDAIKAIQGLNDEITERK